MKRTHLIFLTIGVLAVAVFAPVRVEFSYPEASALIGANVDELDTALGELEVSVKSARRVIRAYRYAQATIDVSAEDKLKYVARMDEAKAAIVTAYNAATAVYVATEPIPEPEGES